MSKKEGGMVASSKANFIVSADIVDVLSKRYLIIAGILLIIFIIISIIYYNINNEKLETILELIMSFVIAIAGSCIFFVVQRKTTRFNKKWP